MLERMRIRNFQRHEDFRIEFDERITTLVGTSDAGKSAVLRALRWVMTGRPTGSSFVRHGQKEALVTLWIDGHKLSRRKSKSAGEIVLDGRKLEAFGSETPEPVRLLCNVDEANFQGQHDQPFWLSLTAGQASRELDAVVNLEEIDRTLTAVLREERKAAVEVELCEKQVEEAKRDCERLRWVAEMEAEWSELEEVQSDLSDAEEELARIEGLAREVEELRTRAAVEVPDTGELDEAVDRLRLLEARERAASASLEEIDRLRRRIDEAEEEIARLQSELEEKSGGTCPLCGGRLSPCPK